MRLVILSDGADHTARILADTARAGGHAVRTIDLRAARWSLRTGGRGGVWGDGSLVEADIVLNRTSIGASGRVSVAALERQRAATWYERFAAAREEQGLLLAVLDRLERDGAEVIDPATTFDLVSMPQLVVGRLAALGAPVVPAGGPVESFVVVRGRVVLDPGQSVPDDAVLRVCRDVARAAEFSLGHVDVDVAQRRPCGWRPQLSLDHGPTAHATSIARGVLQVLTGERPPPPPPEPLLFVPDLVDHLLDPPSTR